MIFKSFYTLTFLSFVTIEALNSRSKENKGGRRIGQSSYWARPFDSWVDDFEHFLENGAGRGFPDWDDQYQSSAIVISSLKYSTDFVDPSVNERPRTIYHRTRRPKSRPSRPTSHNGSVGGCKDSSGFRFDGEVWYSRGCRRHKCIHFRGTYLVESDSCDTEIYNTVYTCIIEVDVQADYPYCCPRYNCNPDNLGNRVNVT